MNDPFGEVPVLPVVIPLGFVVLALLLWRLQAKRLFSFPRAAVALALSVYAAGIVANTVFPIFLNAPDDGEPWTPLVALVPFVDYEITDALMNVAVFVPLGVLIPLVLSRPSWWRVLAIAIATSLGIELTQLAAQAFFAGGHIADVNDLLSNAAGGALGYGLFLIVSRVPWFSRVVDRFRWGREDDDRMRS
jgi:glycopeptide antibiotics resistance protein